jgi:glycine/D-amino acid oxidase-like deaminating enzyme/nitrite reductase/ring-hydroxylating ferredoxin subunit
MNHSQMPQFPEPYWRETPLSSYEALNENTEADVAIVGGGITGVTAAYLLAKQGLKVVILEAGNILNGTTGHTTAKLTAQHGVIYDELISHFGEEKTKLYYQANAEAITFVKDLVEEKKIDCDFSMEDAYIYAVSDQAAGKVQKEYEAYQKLGIDSSFSERIPFNIDIKGAAVMKGQAQFHPLKFLKALLEDFTAAGGKVYENTTAVDIEEGQPAAVKTRNGHTVTAKHVIVASHFPFYDAKGFYFARMEPERSYIVAVKTREEYPGGMYYSADQPTRSLRYTPVNGEKLVLISGDSHKTGHESDTLKHYEALEEFAEEVMGIEEYPYRWSAQDLITLDKIPYVGPITENASNIYVATGYRKWGMTNGIAAAHLLNDFIAKKESPYKEVFTPSRFKADPSIKKFIKYNTDVAGQLIKGKLEYIPAELDDLEPDHGAPVIVNGKRAGAYRDKEGALHIVDTTCTHMGCECEWNNGERTWDCPCHGSRFSYTGEVVEGPAETPLKKIQGE